MLGDLPLYVRHVRRFPREDITIGMKEVGKLTFLFGRELGPDPHHLGQVGGVDPYCLGFLGRLEGTQGGRLVAV